MIRDPAKGYAITIRQCLVHAAEVLIEPHVIVDDGLRAPDRWNGACRRRQRALVQVFLSVRVRTRDWRRKLIEKPRGDAVRRRLRDIVAELWGFDLKRERAADSVPCGLVRSEKEGAVLENGAAEIGAELVELKSRFFRREVVTRGERRVAMKLPGAATERVASRLGLNVDDGPVAAAELGSEVRRLHLHSLDRFEARHDGGLTAVVRVGVHRAVEHVVVAAVPVPVHRHDRRARQLRRVRRARNERRAHAHLRDQEDVALRKGQFIDLRFAVAVGQPPFCGRGHAHCGARDVHGLLERDDRQRNRHFDTLANTQPKLRLFECAEALGFRADRIHAGREARQQEQAGLVCRRGSGLAGGHVLHADGRSRHDLSEAVYDRSLERCFRQLRVTDCGNQAEHRQQNTG